MTAMSKLRAARIVNMCQNYSDYDSSVVTLPVLDAAGVRHWLVSYSHDKYSVTEYRGFWRIYRTEAYVCCAGWTPSREDVKLL